MFRRVPLLYPIKNQFIQNIALPSCNKCKYFVPNKSSLLDGNEYEYNYNEKEDIYLRSTCLKFGIKDIISGEIYNDYTVITRSDESKCGVKGKYYKKIEK